jgi:DNA repair protein RadC
MESNLSLEQLNNVSEIDIVYLKKVNCKLSERPLIQSSVDAYAVFFHYWSKDRIDLLEEFKVLFLNRANRVLQIFTVSRGGVTGTVADPRIILAAALKAGAAAIFLAHNHPSGNLRPSQEDELLTKKIKTAAGYHDIRVLDHLIITSESYFSLADDGLL